MIFLGWEKAFDKVAQDKMLQTLRRLKVPPRICNLVRSFYTKPQFRVNCGEVESEWHTQHAGICEECPVATHLFTLVMGANVADIQARLCTRRQLEPIDGIFKNPKSG